MSATRELISRTLFSPIKHVRSITRWTSYSFYSPILFFLFSPIIRKTTHWTFSISPLYSPLSLVSKNLKTVTHVSSPSSDSAGTAFCIWRGILQDIMGRLRKGDLEIFSNALQHTPIHCATRMHESWRALQHTATHCNTLQHTATHCNTLQLTATHCNTLQYTATYSSILHHTATHQNTLKHIATHNQCNIYAWVMVFTATHCNTLQHIATHCNTLQHTATHCNILQHITTHRDALHYTATMTLQRTPTQASTQPVQHIWKSHDVNRFMWFVF